LDEVAQIGAATALERAARELGTADAQAFTAPEALGWAHQLWNAPAKDRVFEALRAERGRKIEVSDVVPATQLYTERHNVDFLLENSLGALWIASHEGSRLASALPYLAAPTTLPRSPERPARPLTLLDPACGAGHFLVAAFDLLFAMYEEEGERDPAAIAESILDKNLYGMDLDGDAVAIAEAVLLFRA